MKPRKNECGKVAHLTRASAAKAVRKMPRDIGIAFRQPRRGRLAAYQCQRCGLWHIGHLYPRTNPLGEQ